MTIRDEFRKASWIDRDAGALPARVTLPVATPKVWIPPRALRVVPQPHAAPPPAPTPGLPRSPLWIPLTILLDIILGPGDTPARRLPPEDPALRELLQEQEALRHVPAVAAPLQHDETLPDWIERTGREMRRAIRMAQLADEIRRLREGGHDAEAQQLEHRLNEMHPGWQTETGTTPTSHIAIRNAAGAAHASGTTADVPLPPDIDLSLVDDEMAKRVRELLERTTPGIAGQPAAFIRFIGTILANVPSDHARYVLQNLPDWMSKVKITPDLFDFLSELVGLSPLRAYEIVREVLVALGRHPSLAPNPQTNINDNAKHNLRHIVLDVGSFNNSVMDVPTQQRKWFAQLFAQLKNGISFQYHPGYSRGRMDRMDGEPRNVDSDDYWTVANFLVGDADPSRYLANRELREKLCLIVEQWSQQSKLASNSHVPRATTWKEVLKVSNSRYAITRSDPGGRIGWVFQELYGGERHAPTGDFTADIQRFIQTPADPVARITALRLFLRHAGSQHLFARGTPAETIRELQRTLPTLAEQFLMGVGTSPSMSPEPSDAAMLPEGMAGWVDAAEAALSTYDPAVVQKWLTAGDWRSWVQIVMGFSRPLAATWQAWDYLQPDWNATVLREALQERLGMRPPTFAPVTTPAVPQLQARRLGMQLLAPLLKWFDEALEVQTTHHTWRAGKEPLDILYAVNLRGDRPHSIAEITWRWNDPHSWFLRRDSGKEIEAHVPLFRRPDSAYKNVLFMEPPVFHIPLSEKERTAATREAISAVVQFASGDPDVHVIYVLRTSATLYDPVFSHYPASRLADLVPLSDTRYFNDVYVLWERQK